MCQRVHLPAGVLRCSIRFAYQAADAGHPKGQSKLAAEHGHFAGRIHPYQAVRGGISYRKCITPRGKRKPIPAEIPKMSPEAGLTRGVTGEWSKSKAPVFRAAKRRIFRELWQVRRGVPLRGGLRDDLK
jgi:hypothetical protein